MPEIIRLYEIGYDIVQTQRRESGSIFSIKRLTASAFYHLLRRVGDIDIADGTADFRLISREVLEAVRQIREYHRFLRGIIPWLGFRTVTFLYTPSERRFGESKYTFRKMLRLAADGLFSFSLVPLRIGIGLGILLLIGALVETAYVLSFFISGHAHALVPGWSSLIIMLTLTSGITMVLVGFIGVYVGMIFQQVKARPIYILRSRVQRGREGLSVGAVTQANITDLQGLA